MELLPGGATPKFPNEGCCTTGACGAPAREVPAARARLSVPRTRRSTKTCRMKFFSGAVFVFSTIGQERSFSVPYHPARNDARAAFSIPTSFASCTSSLENFEDEMDLTRNWKSRWTPALAVHTKVPNATQTYCGARPP